MQETMKVALVIGSAILMSFIGYAIRGRFGAVMGFVLTLVIVGLFVIWKKYAS